MSDPFDFLPESWSDTERNLWEPLQGYGAFDDPTAQALFNEGYFSPGAWNKDQISAIREHLDDYLMDNYGIVFAHIFDWEAWREAYGEMS
jgi:hypothetical protein